MYISRARIKSMVDEIQVPCDNCDVMSFKLQNMYNTIPFKCQIHPDKCKCSFYQVTRCTVHVI